MIKTKFSEHRQKDNFKTENIQKSKEACCPSLALNDLLCKYLFLVFSRDFPPDELSQEWDYNDNLIIRLVWYTGCIREYGYTQKRFDAAMNLFNRLWNDRLGHNALISDPRHKSGTKGE